MAEEKVTFAAGVPTIWLGILAPSTRSRSAGTSPRVRTMVIGGSAAPASMIEGFQKRHGLTVTHAWGMTETNPLGTVANVKALWISDAAPRSPVLRASQGYAVPFVETRHVNDTGRLLPCDGRDLR
jgi:fatty-acyl-CoA synthase